MKKHQEGTRVRIKLTGNGLYGAPYQGKKGTVTEVHCEDSAYHYRVKLDGLSFPMSYDHDELVRLVKKK